MATPYNGVPGNVAFPAFVAVSGATNANPIVITTAAPHGMTAGDVADVTGVRGNTAANGQWAVTPLSATTFSIPVAGNGAYTSGGSVQPLAIGATLLTPADGDAEVAASVDVAFGTLADRTSLLSVATGAYKLVGLVHSGADDNGGNTLQSTLATADTLWHAMPTIGPLSVGGLIAGDLVEVGFTGTVSQFANPPFMTFSLGWATSPTAALPTAAKLSTTGMIQTLTTASLVHLQGLAVVAGLGCTGYLWLGVQASGAAANTAFAYGDYRFRANIWRATGFPQ